jgi:hypothetical protein
VILIPFIIFVAPDPVVLIVGVILIPLTTDEPAVLLAAVSFK